MIRCMIVEFSLDAPQFHVMSIVFTMCFSVQWGNKHALWKSSMQCMSMNRECIAQCAAVRSPMSWGSFEQIVLQPTMLRQALLRAIELMKIIQCAAAFTIPSWSQGLEFMLFLESSCLCLAPLITTLPGWVVQWLKSTIIVPQTRICAVSRMRLSVLGTTDLYITWMGGHTQVTEVNNRHLKPS